MLHLVKMFKWFGNAHLHTTPPSWSYRGMKTAGLNQSFGALTVEHPEDKPFLRDLLSANFTGNIIIRQFYTWNISAVSVAFYFSVNLSKLGPLTNGVTFLQTLWAPSKSTGTLSPYQTHQRYRAMTSTREWTTELCCSPSSAPASRRLMWAWLSCRSTAWWARWCTRTGGCL